MIEVDVIVLGCGWAGILAAYKLAKYNATILCLEKEQKPGGLLRSEHYRRFVIDIGGSHVIFSKDDRVLNALIELLEANVVRNARSSFIDLGGKLIPYPIETGLYMLPPEDRFEAVKSFLENMLSQYRDFEPKNLLEWIYYAFGSWIAKNYLEPYNRKLWKRPLDQVSLDWISIPGRLPLPDWKEVIKAAVGLEQLVRSLNDARILHSFYFEFGRRLYTLELVLEFCPPGSEVVDLGASPFIVSCALARMGYKVVAVDYDPEEYSTIASACGVKTIRADLERDKLDLADASVDCAVFAEVLEHLNPYYVSHTISEINRVLKPGGKLILTTPNIASLFRRLRLLIGIQPQYVTHVHEYTKKEVVELLEKHGFRVLEAHYSEINDLTLVDAEPGEHVKLKSYQDLLKLAARKPTKLNILRALAYPLVKVIPSLRMLAAVVAEKTGYIGFPQRTTRW